MVIEFNSEIWQNFDYESLTKLEDCIFVKRELEEIINDIETQIRTAEIKVNKGEGHLVDAVWYRAALNAHNMAKRKLKWVGQLRNNLDKEKSYLAKAQEKDRTEKIISLLESISNSLLHIINNKLD